MDRRSAHRSLVGAGVCAVIAASYFLAAFWVVFVLRVGPVVATVDARANQGIHSGDMLGVVFAVAGLCFAASARSLLSAALQPARVRS